MIRSEWRSETASEAFRQLKVTSLVNWAAPEVRRTRYVFIYQVILGTRHHSACIIDAVKVKKHAVSHGHWADHKAKIGDRIGYLATRHDADQMDQRADADLTRWANTTRNRQPAGNGGELTPLTEPEGTCRRDFKRMMVEELPDMSAHQASSDAMNLLADVDVLPAGLEMANSIKAKN